MQETVEQYRQRMLNHLEGRDPLKLQAAAPKTLARLLKGVSASKARKQPAPGKWSIAEIAAHLADTELVGGYRIRTILGAPGAPIQGFDQDELAGPASGVGAGEGTSPMEAVGCASLHEIPF